MATYIPFNLACSIVPKVPIRVATLVALQFLDGKPVMFRCVSGNEMTTTRSCELLRMVRNQKI
ncbi:hypothetical protein IMZ48_28620 [Candidatus Bathyarchaeota archaeon]|nr:hypothetical protein [Candidatus Bathyarchaeota archaeon]